MNTEKKQRLVYFNGKFVPESEAKVSIYDSSLMFGDMVFEMTRSFNKKQFKLKEHISRLMQGIKILRIPFEHSASEIEKACNETIEINSNILKNVRTRIGLMRSDKEPNEDKREEWKRRHKEKDITSTDNESSMSPEFRKSVSPKKTEKTSLQIGKIDEESDMSLTNEDD